ncbi:MAG: hypothetical protein ACOY15_06675 [Pseudomonadota bacterium]
MNTEHPARYDVSSPRAAGYAVSMNYWFWTYLALVPVLVFSATPQSDRRWRVGRLLLAIAACYLLINLAVNLKWDLIDEAIEAMPNPTEEDLRWATADGGDYVHARVIGGLSATTYVGWWELAWRLVYRKKLSGSKLRMQLSSRIIYFSLIVTLLAALVSMMPPKYPYSILNFLHILLPPSADMIYDGGHL